MTSALWIFAGVAAGVFSMISLKGAVDRVGVRPAGMTALTFMAGLVLRMSMVTGVLYLALRQGIAHALFALGGLVITRWLLLSCYARGKLTLKEKSAMMPGKQPRPSGGSEDE